MSEALMARRNRKWIVPLLILVLAAVLIGCWSSLQEGFEGGEAQFKAWYINMDSRGDMRKQFEAMYAASSLSDIPCTRFSGVVGKDQDPKALLTETALAELADLETEKRRLYHYQLTRGGIGCFLSHLSLYRRLLEDEDVDVYLVLEDDMKFVDDARQRIDKALQEVGGWDFILLGWHRKEGDMGSGVAGYEKPTGFWGTFGYLVSRSGAAAMIAEVDAVGMDGQIDAVMCKMQQEGRLRIYAPRKPVVLPFNPDNISMIQTYVVKETDDYDPFLFRGYRV